MKILLSTSRFLPHRGGLETVVYELSQCFRAEDHEVAIITNRYPKSLPGREVIDGINVTRLMFLYPTLEQLRAGRIDLIAAGFVFFPLTLISLWRFIRRFQPEVVNLHYLGDFSLFVWLLSYVIHFKLVVSLHGGDVDGEPHKNAFKRWLFRAVVKRAVCVTACSGALLNQAIEIEPDLEPIGQIIHNGVDIELFRNPPTFNYARSYIAGIGQLAYHKGFDIVIEAFTQVAAKHPNIDLLIAGRGPDQAELESLIQSLGMEDRIKLIGRLDKAGVASFMRHSLFVTMPSRREPFGIVALEGMAAGKIVLATPVGGLPEFANTSVNRLVEPDVAQWILGLDDLLANDPSSIDTQPNQQAAMNHHWYVVTQHYLAVYGGG